LVRLDKLVVYVLVKIPLRELVASVLLNPYNPILLREGSKGNRRFPLGFFYGLP